MYNLFVAGNESAWDGSPWKISDPRQLKRWLVEYTDDELTEKFRGTNEGQVNELRKLPCIFAYEKGNEQDPRFGIIKKISPNSGGVKVQYELIDIDIFLSHEQLISLSPQLDIDRNELFRTHWALKDIDLSGVLATVGIMLPPWAHKRKLSVNITKHRFDVALSFPGEVRSLVLDVSDELERLRGPDTYFYDNNYKSQIARPNADSLLQEIYGKRSDLIVVFLSSKYQEKNWCGLEFRIIREKIYRREYDNIMYIRTDDGDVDGVLETDGYIDANETSSKEIAYLISERIDVLQQK